MQAFSGAKLFFDIIRFPFPTIGLKFGITRYYSLKSNLSFLINKRWCGLSAGRQTSLGTPTVAVISILKNTERFFYRPVYSTSQSGP